MSCSQTQLRGSPTPKSYTIIFASADSTQVFENAIIREVQSRFSRTHILNLTLAECVKDLYPTLPKIAKRDTLELRWSSHTPTIPVLETINVFPTDDDLGALRQMVPSYFENNIEGVAPRSIRISYKHSEMHRAHTIALLELFVLIQAYRYWRDTNSAVQELTQMKQDCEWIWNRTYSADVVSLHYMWS